MEKYIIDNEIVFFPDEKLLLSLKNASKLYIHSTSASCLKLLLERQGEVISHSELMIAGWGTNAKRTVSNAAYYQSFVNLRKALRELGYHKKILMTVRGKGILLHRYIRVKKQTEPLSQVFDRQEILSQSYSLATQNHFHVELNSAKLTPEVMMPHTPEAIANISVKQAIINKKTITVIFLLLLASLFLFYLFSTLMRNDKHFSISGYQHITNTPSCLFFNERNKDNKFIMAFMAHNGFRCEGSKRFFVSYFPESPRLTVFICDSHSSVKCDSVTYIVNKNE